jgi:pimeloyl-ACP methyl ester carboxylesterase
MPHVRFSCPVRPAPAVRRWRFALALLTPLLGVQPAVAVEAPRFKEQPCDIPVASPEVAARLRCGTVRVPRDPARPAAGHFDLAVVVKRSQAPQAGAAPVLFLHGGPGGEQVRFMGRGAKDFAPGRDTVAFDMRGGGRTTPLVCTRTGIALAAATRQALEGQDARPAREAALQACAAEAAAAGLAPEHFGTERNVADAEAIRQALGIAKWNVYGGSYGTTVGADYLARHPQAIESLVLDSLYPPDAFVPPVREAQGRAIARLLDECAADAACARRFPGLTRAQADAALVGLDAQPLKFEFQGRSYAAGEQGVRATLLGLFFNEATARTAPWFLDAVRRRDGQAIAAMLALPLYAGDAMASEGSATLGLMATDCRDRPRHHVADQGPGPSWMALFAGVQSGGCGRWPLGTPPILPVGTAVPVLVLSAGYDGFQPDGAAVARAIGPAATALTVPLAAHVVRGAGDCPRGLVAQFIAQPARTLDTACLAGMTAPAFLLDAAPRPQLVASAFQAQAGQPPWGVLLAGGGLLVWLLAGAIGPALRWGWRRWRGGLAGPHTPLLPWATFGVGLLGVVGLALPLAGTFGGNPGAAAYGLDASLAPVLWALPVAGLGGVALAAWAALSARWLVLVAGLAVAALAIGAWASGATPWA